MDQSGDFGDRGVRATRATIVLTNATT